MDFYDEILEIKSKWKWFTVLLLFISFYILSITVEPEGKVTKNYHKNPVNFKRPTSEPTKI